MMNSEIKNTRTSLMATIAYTICALVLLAVPLVAASTPDAAAAKQRADLTRHSIMRAVLWMRISGEYEALCRQSYKSALQSLRRQLEAHTGAKPPAAILDLDETVLDNSGYQAYLVLNGLSHSQERWHVWQRANIEKVGLVPGAKDFVKEAENLGVHVTFITNRSVALREPTAEALVRLGVAERAALADGRSLKLILREGGRSKENRRRAVAEKYDVLVLVGDNLNDFADDFYARAPVSSEFVRTAVARHSHEWGTRWFVLPNPIYGYWLRFIDWEETQQYFEHTNR